ncbi:hypothetical protein ON010_g18975 [Phytophthora cinnamomi]|nr:hypothetical protein ON010_g18975 [Phytophthora cinnamomi]
MEVPDPIWIRVEHCPVHWNLHGTPHVEYWPTCPSQVPYSTAAAYVAVVCGGCGRYFGDSVPNIRGYLPPTLAYWANRFHLCVANNQVLYQAVRCQDVGSSARTAASPITSALLIGSDAFFVLIALRSIYYQSDVGQARQRLLSMNSKLPATLYYIRNLRALLRDAFQSPPAVRAPRVPIRIRAPFPLHLSAESVAFMDQLELVGRRYSVELPKEATADSTMSKTWSRGRSAKIHYHEKRESSRTMSPTPPHSSKDYLQIPSTPQRINSSFPRPVLAHKVSACHAPHHGPKHITTKQSSQMSRTRSRPFSTPNTSW